MDWGKLIETKRVEINLNADELAERSGVYRSFIYALEEGIIKDPNAYLICKLLNFFNLRLMDVFEDKDLAQFLILKYRMTLSDDFNAFSINDMKALQVKFDNQYLRPLFCKFEKVSSNNVNEKEFPGNTKIDMEKDYAKFIKSTSINYATMLKEYMEWKDYSPEQMSEITGIQIKCFVDISNGATFDITPYLHAMSESVPVDGDVHNVSQMYIEYKNWKGLSYLEMAHITGIKEENIKLIEEGKIKIVYSFVNVTYYCSLKEIYFTSSKYEHLFPWEL